MARKTVSVTAGIIIRRGRVFLARRGPGSHLAGCWELPGGKIEDGESPAECLSRELREELGIEAVIGPFFGRSVHDYPAYTVVLDAYRVEDYTGTLTPTEHDMTAWIRPADVDEALLAPADIPLLRMLGNVEPTGS